MNKNVIVSLADANYFELLNELVDSIKRFDESKEFDICILDAGLEASQIEILEKTINENDPDNLDKTIKEINEFIETKILRFEKKVLDEKVKPAVAKDGGDIKFISFNDGIVKVELRGSCSGCPSSTMTLKQGVQNLLCHYIPEIKEVIAI